MDLNPRIIDSDVKFFKNKKSCIYPQDWTADSRRFLRDLPRIPHAFFENVKKEIDWLIDPR